MNDFPQEMCYLGIYTMHSRRTFRCYLKTDRPADIRKLFLFIHTCRYASVDISFTVCLFVSLCLCMCVCTVTDFSAEDKASGVKFCPAVHRRPRQGITHFCKLCSPEAQIRTNRPARGPRPPVCEHYRTDAPT